MRLQYGWHDKMQPLTSLILLKRVFQLLVCIQQYLQDITLEDLAAELPAHQPRYIAYSYCYKHDDGRISYPLCFIFISPQGMKAGPCGWGGHGWLCDGCFL